VTKVLLIAPTADGDDVGEAWVAFQWASHLSARHELTLLTYRKRGRPAIAGQLPDARVVEWEEPPLLGRAERLNSLLKPGYFLFAWKARRWIKNADARGEKFNVAHQPVPVAMRYPSPLAGSSIPYVIGPVGGSLESPPAFAQEDTAPWFVGLRKLDRFRLRYDKVLRSTYEQAACVLGIAPYVAEHLKDLNIRRFEQLSETALKELPPAPTRRHSGHRVRLLFVGRVIRTKGARDLIAALAKVRPTITADIVGDGYDLPACRRLANSLRIADRVRFHGSLPRAEVNNLYKAADVFVFPSFREPGGNVVFEAMGYGLPLIVCDRGGPAGAADERCALMVSAERPDQYASDLANAITRLASDSKLRDRMGRAARKRVTEVGLWATKIRKVEQIYAEVAQRDGEPNLKP
jgi:glycosyltransferase involved in cell wall biosynthesis